MTCDTLGSAGGCFCEKCPKYERRALSCINLLNPCRGLGHMRAEIGTSICDQYSTSTYRAMYGPQVSFWIANSNSSDLDISVSSSSVLLNFARSASCPFPVPPTFEQRRPYASRFTTRSGSFYRPAQILGRSHERLSINMPD